jgi:hypothetical protein
VEERKERRESGGEERRWMVHEGREEGEEGRERWTE